MRIVAIAFHEHVAMEKLNRYFDSAPAAGGESLATRCSKCSLAFAVILVNRADAQNVRYLDDIKTLIEGDCINGMHQDEYTLSVGTTSDPDEN